MTDFDPVAEIKRKLDIMEFVQQYLPLKKTGINFVGRCPFHEERTPSFTVSPERQTFKCFGCGKGGDVFSFLMEKEGITFPEALTWLADKTGTPLPRRSPREKEERSRRQVLLELNEAAAEFWHQLLLRHPAAAVARDYLTKKRRLTDESIKKWRLGFAPRSATTRDFLLKKGFTPADITLAGEPPRFTGRLIFPLSDVTGRVIGFTGRLLPDAEKLDPPTGPKYWNTPETPVFKKSEALYGLHLTKDALRQTGVAILAEGQMDVIGLHQSGLTNAVASSGTALTDQQLAVLRRFANELAFAYDADSAGAAAAERGFTLALAHDLNPTVMAVPAGEDPASLAAKKPEILTRLYANRQPIIEWLIAQAVAAHGVANPSNQKAVARRVLPWIARVANAVERRGWLDRLAQQVGTTTEALNEELRKLNQSKLNRSQNERRTAPREAVVPIADPLTLLMGLIGRHPSLLSQLSHLSDLTTDTSWKQIYAAVADRREDKLARTDHNRLNEAGLTADRELGALTPRELEQTAAALYRQAIARHNAYVRQKLTTAIAEAEAAGDRAAVDRLMRALSAGSIQED